MGWGLGLPTFVPIFWLSPRQTRRMAMSNRRFEMYQYRQVFKLC